MSSPRCSVCGALMGREGDFWHCYDCQEVVHNDDWKAEPYCERRWAGLRCVHPIGHPGECQWQNPLATVRADVKGQQGEGRTDEPDQNVESWQVERREIVRALGLDWDDLRQGWWVPAEPGPILCGTIPDAIHTTLALSTAAAPKAQGQIPQPSQELSASSGERVTDAEVDRANVTYWTMDNYDTERDRMRRALSDFLDARRKRSGRQSATEASE